MSEIDLIVRPLRLWFKGHRSYLQAPDLFDALVDVSGVASALDASDIRFSLYQPMSHVVDAVRATPGRQYDFRPCALFEFSAAGERVVWALRERSDQPVEDRRPYPEDLVLSGAIVEGSAVTQLEPSPYSFSERVAALNKHLLNRTVEGNRGWWFSRLELKSLPASAQALRLEKMTELSRRLIKSCIYGNGRLLGFVYFTERAA